MSPTARPGNGLCDCIFGDVQDWRLRQREIVSIFLFWMALATLSALNRLLDPRGGAGFRFISPSGPILLGYIEALLWAALTPAIFFVSAWAVRDRLHVIVRALAVAAAGIAIAFVTTTFLDFVRFEMLHVPRRRGAIVALVGLRAGTINQLFIYAAVLTAGFARELAERDRVRRRETERLAVQATQLEAQLAGAKLEALRMQINPHFLFNTLNAISALVERDPAGVRRMIARLSELLRYSLDTTATQTVPLREELRFARRYVEIMKIRFQGRLQFTENIEPEAEEARVPSLILQPLVENALTHGVTGSGGGNVSLSARRSADRLLIAISDEGPGPGDGSTQSGIGLTNTRERLRQMYGEAAGVSLRRGDGAGTIAEIVIPWRTS